MKTLLALILLATSLPAAEHTLYKLTDDPGERADVSAAHPEVVHRLTTRLDKLINDDRSRQRP